MSKLPEQVKSILASQFATAHVLTSSRHSHSMAFNSNKTKLVVGVHTANLVCVFNKRKDIWVQDSSAIFSSNRSNYSHFGRSVSISSDGNTIAVGSSHSNIKAALSAGSVTIFKLLDKTWIEWNKIYADDPIAFSHFGWSVCLNGDGSKLIVGAPYYAPDSYSCDGLAYVFENNNNATWVQNHIFKSPENTDVVGFGNNVTFDDAEAKVTIYGFIGAMADKTNNVTGFDYYNLSGKWI